MSIEPFDAMLAFRPSGSKGQVTVVGTSRFVWTAAWTLLFNGCFAAREGDGTESGPWRVHAGIDGDRVLVTATIGNYHTDFIHMSIRKRGWDSGYDVARTPAPSRPTEDWSRVHDWFGGLHRATYLEGRIDDGRGVGPDAWTTVALPIPRAGNPARQDFADEDGSSYLYVTTPYGYADGQAGHPPFDRGEYEIEIYPWYSGEATALHRALGDRPRVQYLHHEVSLASTTFVVE